MVSRYSFIFLSLIVSEIEQLFMCLRAICSSFSVDGSYLFVSVPVGLLVFSYLFLGTPMSVLSVLLLFLYIFWVLFSTEGYFAPGDIWQYLETPLIVKTGVGMLLVCGHARLNSHVWLSATSWTVCSPPASSVHGIIPARILEWVAISSASGSSQSRDQTCVSCIGR